MSNYRDIDGAHKQFLAEHKLKQEKAEKLRLLFDRGKSLLSRGNKEPNKETEKKPSSYIEQKRQQYSAQLPVSPRHTPTNAYTAMKRKESLEHQWIHHKSFERSITER